RVLRPGEAERRAARLGVVPAQPEERPAPHPGGGGHPGERARPGPAAEPEQHGLGLVVEGVSEQDGGGTVLGGRVPQRAVAGGAGGGRRATAPLGLDLPDLHRLQPEAPARGCRRGGDVRAPRLQAVVDDDGARAQPGPRSDERGGGGEGQRVRAARAGDEDERARGKVGERLADGQPGGGDRGGRPRHGQPWTRRTQASGSKISVLRGSVSAEAHTALSPLCPTRWITRRTNSAPLRY